MSSIVEHVVSSVGRLRLVPVLVLLAFGCACGAWLLPRWRRQRVTIYGASDKDMRRALTDGYRRVRSIISHSNPQLTLAAGPNIRHTDAIGGP